MKTFCLTFLISLLCADGINAQVIYERTYPNAYPSLKEVFQLSDYSTVSFANNSTCYFAGWRHISSTGSIIKQGGVAGESTHSLNAKHVGVDSILVSCRIGPLDFNMYNYFQVALWTPDTMTTLVLDSLTLNYWDDCEWCNSPIHYEAFQIHDNHLLYQKGDTIYSKNLVTGNIDFQEVFNLISKVYSIEDGLLVFSENLPPTYFNSRIEQIRTLTSLVTYPYTGSLVSLDSFLLGQIFNNPTSLHAINVFNESGEDIDLSAYFTQIESLVVRGDTLIVVGSKGAIGNTIHLNKYFQILNEKPFEYPDNIYTWELSFYPDRLYAWRLDGLSGYGADYRVVYPYSNPNPISYLDLEFVDIKVDSVYYYSSGPGAPLILKLSAYIKNQSSETLDNVTIHYSEDPFQMCDPGVYPSHRYNLQTPAGDTAVAKLTITAWPSDIGKPFIRTFYVQHGNNHLDSNRIDNSFSLNYLITNTGESIQTEVSIYPNPFTDALYIKDLPEGTHLSLFNQAGQLMTSGIGRFTDLGFLPPGIYFLQIIDGQSIRTTRVIKAE